VQWTLELITHIPYPSTAKDIGLQLTVVSLTGDEKQFTLQSTTEPEPVERAREDLPGRKDNFLIQLPPTFEPAAVKIWNK
jgi:hypothetical protein